MSHYDFPLVSTLRVAAFCIAVATTAAAVPPFTVVDIGAVGLTGAWDINNAGQIAGGAYFNGAGTHAFFYASSTVHDLGTLGGTKSYGYAINAAGVTVGTAGTGGAGGLVTHAFRHSGTGPLTAGDDLGTLGTSSFGPNSSSAFDINAAGVIVGDSMTATVGQVHAFRHVGAGTLTAADDLGTFGGKTSSAWGVNNTGLTVGGATLANGTLHAFRHSGGGTLTAADDMLTLGGPRSSATDVNDLGWVAGWSDVSGGGRHAFLHKGAGTLSSADDLGTLGGLNSDALAVNLGGWVVGISQTALSGSKAFLHDGTAMYDLNTLVTNGAGWNFEIAHGVNDNGWIVGKGTRTIGSTTSDRAFLLIPVPEPGAIHLALLAAAAFVARRGS